MKTICFQEEATAATDKLPRDVVDRLLWRPEDTPRRLEQNIQQYNENVLQLVEAGLLSLLDREICHLGHGCSAFNGGHIWSAAQTPAPDSSAVSRWEIPTVIYWRGSSASPLCIDIIACCPTRPSFNDRRSSFSGRRFPRTVEHSAAERHVGIVNICFQETFEDPSLQSFYLWISCSACAVTLSFWHYNRSFLLTYSAFSNSPCWYHRPHRHSKFVVAYLFYKGVGQFPFPHPNPLFSLLLPVIRPYLTFTLTNLPLKSI